MTNKEKIPSPIPTTRGRRLLAATIDTFMSSLFGYGAVVLSVGRISDEVSKQVESRMQNRPSETELLQMLIELPILGHVIALSFGMMLAYYAVELLTPYTLGKLIVGIKIASADGTPSSITQRTVRFTVKHIPFIVLLVLGFDPGNVLMVYSAVTTITLAGVGPILLPDKMALHDYVSKTKVLDVR